MTTWLVQLHFLPGERPSGVAVATETLPALRELPGVEQLDFHLDVNDDCALWASGGCARTTTCLTSTTSPRSRTSRRR